jgi:hypothetical protein
MLFICYSYVIINRSLKRVTGLGMRQVVCGCGFGYHLEKIIFGCRSHLDGFGSRFLGGLAALSFFDQLGGFSA